MKVYTPEHIRFLKKIIKGRSMPEITKLFNKRFRMSKSPDCIKSLCTRNGLKTGYRSGWPGWNRIFYDKHIEILKKIAPGRYYAETALIFNRRFGMSLTAKQLSSACARHGISSGLTGYFPKGNVPFNKGRKGYCAPGSEKGWFKKGQKPWQTLPIGSEIVSKGGYIKVKYSDRSGPSKNRWKSKHSMIWEKKHGPVPKGYVVIFLDGNNRNFALNNLQLVSRAELRVMNHQGLMSKNKDITKVGHTLAAAKIAIGGRKRGSFKAVKSRKIIFLNNNGYKVYVIKEKGRYMPVRETCAGSLVRMRVKKLKSRASRSEAQRDLYEYAAYRGWMRI